MSSSLQDRVARVIRDEIEPAFAVEGGSIELVDVSDGIAQVRFHGGCASCPATISALVMGLEQELRSRFPNDIQYLEAVP
ncbi:MAG: NifU family protein [Gemmataceae bacterium]|nr:NifU family protein [Gemmataceae bacterium]